MMDVVPIPGHLDAWRVGTTEFVRYFGSGSTPERLFIQKDQSIIDLYVELCPAFQHGRIVELGIAAGGSTALLALLTQPTTLVACDVAHPVPALEAFIEKQGLGATVRTFYGVDQGDAAQLEEIVGREFGEHELDLVIDDASHVWDKTVSSFEVLYPRLRPGGLFVIEDWSAQYMAARHISAVQADPSSAAYARAKAQYEDVVRAGAQARPPLARLGVELMLASVASPRVIERVSVDRHWITVRRGPAPIDPESFRLADLYSDDFGWLEEEPGHWWYGQMWERHEPSTIEHRMA